MADLEELIRQVNRDMEEHRRQAEHREQVEESPQAMTEQRRQVPEDWIHRLERYCRHPVVPFVIASVIGGFAGCGCAKFLMTVLGV
jgi:hypothetical protein